MSRIGGGASQPRQIVDAPRHHCVDRQAGFQAVGGSELAILDLTAALENAVEHFDAPALGIPLHPLDGVDQAGYRDIVPSARARRRGSG